MCSRDLNGRSLLNTVGWLVAHIIWFATYFFSDFTGLSEGQGIMSTK